MDNKIGSSVNAGKSTVPTTTKIVDGMTYKTTFFFSNKTKETFSDKIIRIVKNVSTQNT